MGINLAAVNPFSIAWLTALDQQMGDAYPELRNIVDHVERVLHKEEQRFAETLEQGMRILEDAITIR